MKKMNKKQKEEQYELFADAFHEVVVPLLENLATKDGIDRIERKIDKSNDRSDRHGKTLDGHEVRIGKLETHTGIAS